MKKFLSLTLSLVMAASLLVGCGSSASSSTSASSGDAMELPMATGGTSGTYYGFCGVVAQVLNEKCADTMSITVESTGASKANIQLVDVGECQLGIVQNDVMYYAYTGTDMFEGEEPCESFSAVAACYPEQIQVIASKKITSLDQLKGKKVSVGNAGSGVEFNARQVLEAYGVSFDDITVSNQSFADSADALKNGTIDAAFITAGAPTTAVTELSSTFNFNLLSVDDEHVAALQEKYSFYTPVTIAGGTYDCVPDDVQTVAVLSTVIARNDVPEEVIYAFTKGLFENQAEIAAAHTKGELLSVETAVPGINIPFHAGAEQYYKEVGAM